MIKVISDIADQTNLLALNVAKLLKWGQCCSW